MVEVGKIGDKTLVLDGRYISIFRGGKLVWKRRYMAYPLPDGNLYLYRRRVRITEQSGKTLTDYQIRIEIGAGDPIWEHARSAGEDIRFCYYPEEEMLSYWIEKFDPDAEEAIIWVKVPEIPANSEIEIYMYYGNPTVASASDVQATFDLYDDFEDGVLGSQWEYHDGCSVDDYYEESGGVGTIHVNYVDGCSTSLSHANYNDTPVLEADIPDADFELIVVYYNWNPPAGEPPYHEIGISFVQDEDDFIGHMLGHSDWQNVYTRSRYKVDAGSSTITETARHTPDTQTYRYVKVIRTGDTYHFYYSTDGENWTDEGSETKAGLTKVALSVYVGSGSYTGSFDFIRIRRYAEIEPSVSVGGEE